jgi:hypothetical protein
MKTLLLFRKNFIYFNSVAAHPYYQIGSDQKTWEAPSLFTHHIIHINTSTQR